MGLIGSGFSRAQDLLVQFGSTDAVETVFVNESVLECVLPRTHSSAAGVVSVTLLHQEDRSKIPNDPDVEFRYLDLTKEGL